MTTPFPHGTPAGHSLGCRGAECLNRHTALMTCDEAAQRYRGDYAYMKAVDAGTATTDKYSAPKLVPRIIRETPAAAKKRAKVKVKAKEPRSPRKPLYQARFVKVAGTNFRHGTMTNARRGCVTDCPQEAAGGQSCQTAKATFYARQNARAQAIRDARKLAGLPAQIPAANPIVHGTAYGASSGKCTDCPETLAGRPSCVDVRRVRDQGYRDKARAVKVAALREQGMQ